MGDDVKEIIQALTKWNNTKCNGDCKNCKLGLTINDLEDEDGEIDVCVALIKAYEKLTEDDE